MTNIFLFLKSIVYGIVEGISEWLPISSTGHLILLEEFLNLGLSKDFMEMFNVVIQLGAILAVVVIFFNKLWPFSKKEKNYIDKEKFNMWFKILVSCIPAILIGLPFDDYFNNLFYNPKSVSIALILVGFIFILVEIFNKKESKINSIKEITYKTALIIGCFQVVAAIFPGVSRSGATIIGALLIGVKREVIAEYTFYLAIPVMFGASLLKILKFGLTFTGIELIVLILGMLSAFIVSILVIKFFMGYIKKHDFKIFGYYRIILGIIILLILGR